MGRVIGRGAEKKAGRLRVQLHQRSSQPGGGGAGCWWCHWRASIFGGPHLGRARGGRAPRAVVGLVGVALASRVLLEPFLVEERALMRATEATEGVGFVWGVTGLLGPRFLVSRCVDRGPGEEQEMHRWERHGRADRVFNATIPDEPRCACGPRLVDPVRGSVSGIWNLESGIWNLESQDKTD